MWHQTRLYNGLHHYEWKPTLKPVLAWQDSTVIHTLCKMSHWQGAQSHMRVRKLAYRTHYFTAWHILWDTNYISSLLWGIQCVVYITSRRSVVGAIGHGCLQKCKVCSKFYRACWIHILSHTREVGLELNLLNIKSVIDSDGATCWNKL